MRKRFSLLTILVVVLFLAGCMNHSVDNTQSIDDTTALHEESEVKNITNKNQKKAYHMYRYVVMQDYKDLEEYIQTSQEEIA